jgi:hypothetical protein
VWAAVSFGTALPDPGSLFAVHPHHSLPLAVHHAPNGNTLANGNFEQGTSGWTQSDHVITNSALQAARGGTWYAWMMGYGIAAIESLSQSNIAVPSTGTPKLTFWLKVSTQESGYAAYDTLKVKAGGTTLATTPTPTRAPGTSRGPSTFPPTSAERRNWSSPESKTPTWRRSSWSTTSPSADRLSPPVLLWPDILGCSGHRSHRVHVDSSQATAASRAGP